MKVSDAFPSKYKKASELGGRELRVTMSHVLIEEVGQNKDSKPVLHFRGDGCKPLVLNVVNSNAIAERHGDEMDAWTGHDIILFPAMTDYKGKMVECVRVRHPVDQTDVAPAQPAPAQQPASQAAAAPEDFPAFN